MHSVKEKVSNAASAGQEHVDIYKAHVQEKAEKATAGTKEEKAIAHEKRKAKEAEAKMNLHLAKSQHAADKLHHLPGQAHHNQPVVGTGVSAPTHPLGGHPPGHNNYI
ncbi:Seed maturation protein [Heracleum sosnowskyi]|uniref:Seed maturation protein n=1 Tax=Heracleum sosnowskyi TaxID=360622 RepID=A0AAD8MJB8_9APIA|nr:Seed maturation protein [Heracleum sosnowskyi]